MKLLVEIGAAIGGILTPFLAIFDRFFGGFKLYPLNS
jgi:hypothetical protein